MIPGTIPGLLRRGSPIILGSDEGQRPGVVVDADPAFGGRVVVMLEATPRWDAESDCVPADRLSLDLTDPTGRWHAAQWLWENGFGTRGRTEADTFSAALAGDSCDASILAALVFRVAGVSP